MLNSNKIYRRRYFLFYDIFLSCFDDILTTLKIASTDMYRAFIRTIDLLTN
jgi:hypothetical protein